MLLCSCSLYFSSRLEFNIETAVMVTSLLLSLHHAVTALILNPTTVEAVVLTSRPGRFTRENTQGFIEQDTGWVPEKFCMFWSKEKVLTLSEFPTSIPPQSSQQTGHCVSMLLS
jgi:hypothetical protein